MINLVPHGGRVWPCLSQTNVPKQSIQASGGMESAVKKIQFVNIDAREVVPASAFALTAAATEHLPKLILVASDRWAQDQRV